MRMLKVTELGDSQVEKPICLKETKMVEDEEGFAHQPSEEAKGEPPRSAGWRSLLNFMAPSHWIPFILALVVTIASGIVIPALAIFLGKIFDSFTNFGAGQLSGRKLVQKISIDCYALLGLGSASWMLNGAYFMLWLVFGELQAKSVRDKLFDGMLEKDLEWFEMRKSGVGALLPRLQTQVRELQIATSQPLGFAAQYSVTALTALGLAFYTSWKLTLVTLATVPVSAIALSVIASQMQPSIEAQQVELTMASKLLNNALSAIDTVKCFNGQDFEIRQYARAIARAAKYYLKQARSNALQIGFVRIMTLGMFVQGFWYGSSLVGSGKTSAGDVLTTFWACLMATQAIEQILPQMIVLEKGRAAGAALKGVLEQMHKGRRVVKMRGKETPTFCEGDIEIRYVSFAYPSRPDHLVLDQVNFFFPAGETTFVVGRSGSGKSTVGNLLLRFYNPTAGDVLIDCNSIKTLDINWLRNNITLVQQQSILFNETIFRNIAFGRRDFGRVKKGQIRKSIEVAMLQHTINDLPKGLETMVGTGGNTLSGGQKQRVAVARARLRNTPILILDESTSALDYISRTLVMDAIRSWRKGKTTIIITHDMSQIYEDDFVYVLEHGRVVQEGFRRNLETTVEGSFPPLLTPQIAPAVHCDARKGSVAALQSRERSDYISRPFQDSSRPSLMSKDPLEVQILPRPVHLPTIFGKVETAIPYRRPSQGLLSPLSPNPCPPIRRRSSCQSTEAFEALNRQRNRETTLSLFAPHLSNEEDLEMMEMTGAPTRLNRVTSKGKGRRLSLPKSHAISTASISGCNKHRKRERKLSQTEKQRRILSIQKILLTVWPNLRLKHRILLILGFFCAFLHAAAIPVFSYVFSQLLGTFFLRSNRAERALTWSLSILGIAVTDAVSSYLMHYLLEQCGQAWIDTLRVEALKRILDQPRPWFDRGKNSLSKLTVCLDRNAEEMRNLVGRFAGFVFVAVSIMVMAIVWSLIVCWKLTLIGLACGPLLYAITRGFEAVSGKWENRSNDAGEAAGSIFVETFTDIRTVRALTLESYFHKKYTKATSNAMGVGLRRSAYSGFFFGLSDSGIIFVNALIFYFGAILVSSRHYSTQDVLTVLVMLLFSIANANAVVAFIPQINSSRDTATRLLRLANLPLGSSHEHTGHLRILYTGPINFINLNFTYPSRLENIVLRNFNVTIPANTCTAIVGPSGSGKSTISSLLLGLYPPTNSKTDPPTITIGGRDIRQLHIPTLRSLIAIVPQTPSLFATSVRDNISYGLEPSSPLNSTENIRAAAQAADIDEFITTLPRGYATPIGDGGVGLSGGQAQRLIIARALARRPKILILDEATSSLDAESAEVVRQSVKRLVGDGKSGMTVIIITHAQEMMEIAENVVVVEEGRVVEEGPYGALLGRPGNLKRMLSAGVESVRSERVEWRRTDPFQKT